MSKYKIAKLIMYKTYSQSKMQIQNRVYCNTDLRQKRRYDQMPGKSKYPQLTGHTDRAPLALINPPLMQYCNFSLRVENLAGNMLWCCPPTFKGHRRNEIVRICEIAYDIYLQTLKGKWWNEIQSTDIVRLQLRCRLCYHKKNHFIKYWNNRNVYFIS
jgi:hypothetical protein